MENIDLNTMADIGYTPPKKWLLAATKRLNT